MLAIITCTTITLICLLGLLIAKEHRKLFGLALLTNLAILAFASFTTVPASNVAVVTTFGRVSDETLSEGAHFVLPWQTTHRVYTGMDVAAATKAEAASKDLQSVHADLTVNFHVEAAQARSLYQQTPALNYTNAFVVPAMYEVFKGVVAQYTAEELVTRRQDVSTQISSTLNDRLAQFHLRVQNTNLVNFGFSKAFDAAIEEKVTALQKAATAENNLKRTRFEAEQRITQAEGEAKAIAIQSAAIEKAGGQGYVQLQAIGKWDGKLPQYVTSGSAVPFVSVK